MIDDRSHYSSIIDHQWVPWDPTGVPWDTWVGSPRDLGLKYTDGVPEDPIVVPRDPLGASETPVQVPLVLVPVPVPLVRFVDPGSAGSSSTSSGYSVLYWSRSLHVVGIARFYDAREFCRMV